MIKGIFDPIGALGHRIGEPSLATPESKSSSDLTEALRGTVHTARNYDRPGNDDTGVFTVLFLDAMDERLGPVGMQYQPLGISGTPSSSFGTVLDDGIWRNVTFPLNYHWVWTATSTIFNYKDAQNKNHLMHAVRNRTDIWVSTLDSATMIMVQGASPWNFTIDGIFPSAMGSNGKSLFAMTDFFGQGILYELQINNASTAPTVLAKAHNIGDTKNGCKAADNVFIGPLGAGIVLYCQDSVDGTGLVATFNGTNSTLLPPLVGRLQGLAGIYSMSPVASSPIPFVFLHDMWGTYSIPLGGNLNGVWINGKNNVSVTEDFGDVAPALPTTGNHGPISDWGSKLGKPNGKKNAGIIGGVCAVVVVVLAVLGFLLYRRKRQFQRISGGGGLEKHIPAPAPSSAATPQLTQPLPLGQQATDSSSLLSNGQNAYTLQGQAPYTNNHSNSSVELKGGVPSVSPMSAYSSFSPNLAAPSVPRITRPFTAQQGFP
ncbi:MAG: hypothetical protein J3Q66DRAFT_417510 [Benniella sp.]|nr:MAG: hypothetical protein J3Q66DRAFT_417510 [Benniella sp.]